MQTSYARRTAQALALASLAWLAAPAQAAEFTQVSIIGGIPQTPSTAKGDVFYKATFSINYLGGQLILSGSPDGTGYTYVDDVLYMKVTHPDGTVSTLTNNYYASGCTAKKDLPSMDIASKFMPGVNKVYVEFRDKCGGNVDASSMWLSNF